MRRQFWTGLEADTARSSCAATGALYDGARHKHHVTRTELARVLKASTRCSINATTLPQSASGPNARSSITPIFRQSAMVCSISFEAFPRVSLRESPDPCRRSLRGAFRYGTRGRWQACRALALASGRGDQCGIFRRSPDVQRAFSRLPVASPIFAATGSANENCQSTLRTRAPGDVRIPAPRPSFGSGMPPFALR